MMFALFSLLALAAARAPPPPNFPPPCLTMMQVTNDMSYLEVTTMTMDTTAAGVSVRLDTVGNLDQVSRP